MHLPVPYLFELKPNRVRRNYRGGQELDRLEGSADPKDNECPEDWIASTVLAKNPGLSELPNEGMTYLQWRDCPPLSLKECFQQYPVHMLGTSHMNRIGLELGFLTKLLDSSMRLHVQAHPTAQFAQLHLNSNHGKLESYVVLGTRDGKDGYLRLGFQKAVSAAEWKRIVLEQDIPAMDALFERVPVKPGEVWFVPARLPHAIGEGLLVLEVMEPSDLVVRCEFEREGIVVPPEARFMGRDPDLALQIFDRHAYSLAQITRKCRIEPQVILVEKNVIVQSLIGPAQTPCFEVRRVSASGYAVVPSDGRTQVGIVSKGTGVIRVPNRKEEVKVKRGSRFLVVASAKEVQYVPDEGSDLEVLICQPNRIP